MSGFSEYDKYDGLGLAELVQKKEVKPSELIEEAISRIESINPKLNAVVTPMYEEARKQAQGQLPDGPFRGVPFLIKDLLAEVSGIRMTEGSAFMSDFIPEKDTELVSRLRRTGLIFIGKTNTSEFGLLPTAEPHLFGPTLNPWDTSCMSGGSSGGAAAAVASGMVPIANGSDGGGSIRIPASCCGIFGLKPTRARTPLGPQWIEIISGLIVAEHALTRSVRDSAALLDATCGPVSSYPYRAPIPECHFAEEVGADPGNLRIAFTTKTPQGTPVHEDCIEAVQDAAKLCADLGHEITEDCPEIDEELTRHFGVVWSLLPACVIDYWKRRLGKEPKPDHFEPMTWALYEWGRTQNVLRLYRGLEAFQRITERVSSFFNKYDVLLTPTVAEPPLPVGTFDSTPDNPLQGLTRSAIFTPFASTYNITGQPAMSVPLFWNQGNLPIGTHFVARYGEEATLFRLAGRLEEARPWANRRPPVSLNEERRRGRNERDDIF